MSNTGCDYINIWMNSYIQPNTAIREKRKTNFGINMSMLASMDDFIIMGNELWFSQVLYNGLLKLDLNTGEVTYVLEFEDETNEILLSTTMFEYEKKMYFIPGHAKYIYSYERENHKIEKIKLPEGNHCIPIQRKYHNCLENSDICLSLPYDSRTFLIFDKKEKKFKCDGRWYEAYRKKFVDKGGSLFISSNVLVDGRVYLGMINSNKLMRYDLNNGQCDFIAPIEENDRIVSLCKKQNSKWLISANGMVVQLNEFDEITQEGNINFISEEEDYFSCYYSQIESIVIAAKKYIIIYSINNASVRKIEYPRNGELRCLCKYTKDKVYFDLSYMESIWFFEILDFTFHEIELSAGEQMKYEIVDRCVLNESKDGCFNLSTLLQMV